MYTKQKNFLIYLFSIAVILRVTVLDLSNCYPKSSILEKRLKHFSHYKYGHRKTFCATENFVFANVYAVRSSLKGLLFVFAMKAVVAAILLRFLKLFLKFIEKQLHWNPIFS